MLSGLNFIKDPICLPPPVMFSLSKLSLPVVAVNIRPSSIDTGPGNGSEHKMDVYITQMSSRLFGYQLVFCNVPWTIIGRLAREFVLMGLERKGIEYLHSHTEIYGSEAEQIEINKYIHFHKILPDKIVDIFIPNIMTEYK